MKDRVCLITGANSGIGKTTAIEMARLGTKLVILCRSKEKAEEAAAAIRAESGAASVDFVVADLSSQESIRKGASDFLSRYGQLHILINNAGLAPKNRTLTPEGIEMTFAVNHLGYFLLTHLLMPALKSGAPSRIVNVASEAHKAGRLDFGNLQGEVKYTAWSAYARSKLCNILFTRELARRLEGSPVTANALHPGYVATAIFRDTPGFFRALVRMTGMNPWKGAENSVHVAASPELQGVSGKYFVKKKEAIPAAHALDSAGAQKLWSLSEKLTGVTW